MVGLGDGTQIILARHIEENKSTELPKVFTSAIIIQFLCDTPFLGLFIRHHHYCYQYLETLYCRATRRRFLSIETLLSKLLIFNYQAYFLAKGKPHVLFSAGLSAIKHCFRLRFNFGNLGCAELGVQGAALASTLSDFNRNVFNARFV